MYNSLMSIGRFLGRGAICMLEKNIDMALIGKNYPSFILGLDLLKKGNKVLLLDDDRFRYGESFTNYIGDIERNFLIECGKELDSGPLIKIDNYLKRKNLTYDLLNKRIRLGADPWMNLLELSRKFFFCWDNEKNLKRNEFHALIENCSGRKEFNVHYDGVVKKMAFMIFQMDSTVELTFENITKCNLGNLIDLFIPFRKSVLSDDLSSDTRLHDFHTMIYAARGFYHNKPAFFGNDLELLHLFLGLLSPLYEVDNERLQSDLMDCFTREGGYFKKAWISEYFFDKQVPWAMELDSFEGVVFPEMISFLGTLLEGVPIKFAPQSELYASAVISWKNDDVRPCHEENEVWIFSSVDKIGTNEPFWQMWFSEGRITAMIYFCHQKGMKLNFVKKSLMRNLEKELKRHGFSVSEGFQDADVQFSTDVCIREEKISISQMDRQIQGRIAPRVMSMDENGSLQLLKKVYYLGPVVKKPLGLISTLHELNVSRKGWV